MHQPRRRDPDRLLPADPRTRDIARDLYLRVADAPIVSPHGHVPVEWLAEDRRFRDPADLLITHDHYVTRLLHAGGVDLEQLGVGWRRRPAGGVAAARRELAPLRRHRLRLLAGGGAEFGARGRR